MNHESLTGLSPMYADEHDSGFVVHMPDVFVSNGEVLRGVSGRGKTHPQAVDDLWTQLTDLDPAEHVVVKPDDPIERLEVRWTNGQWKKLTPLQILRRAYA